jgi:O-6-methylguanine DNA methyltransferase
MPGRFQQLKVDTSWGPIRIERVAGKVTACSLPRIDETPEVPFEITGAGSDPVSLFIVSVFTGTPQNLPMLGKLNGTEFQSGVWNAISRIPAGQTLTYGELAAEINHPTAFRAVANACGRNPVPLFVPCHRILAANGNIGGFSCGLAWKRLLLSAER